METWAHSQDVYDVLGRKRINGPELFHIAHLGAATFAWSFKIHGQIPPQISPRIELTAPSGEIWTWGASDAGERVWGSAEDFCLVVTQRRNIRDTALKWQGPNVANWLSIAQAFAGIPQEPPAPGERVVDFYKKLSGKPGCKFLPLLWAVPTVKDQVGPWPFI